MARFWILSDLHQEYAENRFDLVRPTEPFDAVIAAGDVCGPVPDAIAWLRRALPNDEIVYVPGNHCFWQDPALAEARLPMVDLLRHGAEAARQHGVRLLSDDATVIGGVRILGSTLWTDYCVEGMYGQRTAMRVAEKGMNDYRRIRRPSSTRPTKPIKAQDLLHLHRASVAYLDDALAQAFDGPTVLVTHHAPAPMSLSAPFDSLNPCYANDLRWLMQRHVPPLWVHGHVHVPSDYLVGQTRVVCNPRGYAGEIQQSRWDASFIVEI